ncbi:hypothetical protein P8452_14151 [Trifolium repens]|nr:hypothetical protein P8452_14151 [Trifolium repens]
MEAEPLGGSTGTPDLEKEGTGVHVGDIVLNLANCKRRVVQSDGVQHEKKQVPKDSAMPVEAAKGKESSSMFLRNYRSKPEDAQWANNGLVATVNNGEAIPVVETRIADAGFSDLVIIPMGADKVFIRRTEGGDALDTVGGAVEFFNLVFSNWTRWEKDGRPYQRGAWVRLFVRADSCSAEKDRLDFARVLIATSDLSIVNRVERVLVDGTQVDIKIVEEWGYALGEDTCLFEEEDGSEPSQADEDAAQDEPEIGRNVDLLVEKCVGMEEEEEGDNVESQNGDRNPYNNVSAVGDSEEKESWNEEVLSPVLSPVLARTDAHLTLSMENPGGSISSRTDVPSPVPITQGSPSGQLSGGLDGIGARRRPLCSRATSCPPSEDRKALSGPCQASSDLRSASGTSENDWRNWVAVHGNDQLAMEDIQGIGQTIGVAFRGDVGNMFNALTRAGSNKGETSGHQKWKGSQKEKRC